MKMPYYHIDAFTGTLFSGNPAAVVFPQSTLPYETMLAIARESNLAETAFVQQDGADYQIRWFTPTIEVDLCGHATLASAHVIFNHLNCRADTITFASKSGDLHVRKEGEFLYLNFPTDNLTDAEIPTGLIEGLGATPKSLFRGRDDYIAVFEDEKIIAAMTPDMEELSRVPARGIIVTSTAIDYDFVSRFFAPQSGIPEDSVTGSAHTSLIPHWSGILGKKTLRAKQISVRGGELMCQYLGDRVEIGGRAVTYLTGEISV